MKKVIQISMAVVVITSAIVLSSFNNKNSAGDSPDLVKTAIPMFEAAKKHALEVAEAMPEESYGYKPTDVSKTFGQQMVHLGYATGYFATGMIKGEQMEYNEPDASTLSKSEIKEIINKGFDDMIAALKNVTAEDLKVELPLGPTKKITRAQAILFANDHATNHRAKANLYIRMNEIEPPKYNFM